MHCIEVQKCLELDWLNSKLRRNGNGQDGGEGPPRLGVFAGIVHDGGRYIGGWEQHTVKMQALHILQQVFVDLERYLNGQEGVQHLALYGNRRLYWPEVAKALGTRAGEGGKRNLGRSAQVKLQKLWRAICKAVSGVATRVRGESALMA